LIASGSEVQLTLEAQERLWEMDIDTRVVSMPSWELFEEEEEEYQDEILPPEVRERIAIEAGSSLGWCRWTGDAGLVIGVNRFGASAPAKEIFGQYGFTAEHVVEHAKQMARRR